MSDTSTRRVVLRSRQTRRLSCYCASYSRCLVQEQRPSLRRNQAIRATQVVQARLAQQADGCTAQEHTLLLNQEEASTLRQMVVELLRQQQSTPPCEQRTALIAELADALVLLSESSASDEHRATERAPNQPTTRGFRTRRRGTMCDRDCADLLTKRRRYIHADQLRAAIVDVTNATFQARLHHIW